MTDIRESQPAITVILDGKVHVISVADLRMTANDDGNSLLLRCMAKALTELVEGVNNDD